MRADLDSLEAVLDYRFHDRGMLDRALTHRSHVNERLPAAATPEPDVQRHNEQLEFLGDSILGFLISEELVRRFPELPEGRLSKMKAHLVSAVHLQEVARRLDIGRYLRIGRGEELSGGRGKRTLLVDAVEALLAALYLDGGMEGARNFVEEWVLAGTEIDQRALEHPAAEMLDYKSALQELAQSRKLPQPRYVTVRERGPEHSKTFTVEVRIGKEYATQADGLTKKSAAQKAARAVFERMQAPPLDPVGGNGSGSRDAEAG
jgi:ribonuclease-3